MIKKIICKIQALTLRAFFMLNMSIKNQDRGFASPQRAKEQKTQLYKEFQ